VFSRPAKHNNNEFRVFQKPLPARNEQEQELVKELRGDEMKELFDEIKSAAKQKVFPNLALTEPTG
jgi:hypothetical protein